MNDPYLRWQIGKVRITRVMELGGPPFPGTFMFPQCTAGCVQQHAWLRPHFANDEGKLFGSVHSFIIESQGRRIIVDTCVGNDKERTVKAWHKLQGPFLDKLAEAGFPADSIDTVLCTHLHVDHVGWNTRWDGERWVASFPRARYLFARKEWEHWISEQADHHDGPVMEDSVKPIVDAGLAELVASDHRITDEVWLEPTHGHTPGHVSVRIRSGGEEAVITGDLMHHPIQCSEPDWGNRFDVDGEAARRTRHDFLKRHADTPVLVMGTHFAPPTAGWVLPYGNAWRLETDPSQRPQARPETKAEGSGGGA